MHPDNADVIPTHATATKTEAHTQTRATLSSQQIILPKLLGLSISGEDAHSLAGQATQKNELLIVDFDHETEKKIRLAASPFLGQPVSRYSLKQLSDAIEAALRQPNKPLLIARFPAQEITHGYLALTIAEAKIQQTRVKAKWVFGKNFSLKSLKSRQKNSVNAETIRKNLAWLNQNPFRLAAARWESSPDKANTADLIYTIAEKRPWSVNAGLDNYASRGLGDERLFLGGRLGNVFNLDHRLSWNLLSSTDGDQLRAWFLSYQIPLPQQLLLNISLNQSKSHTIGANDVENNGSFFSLHSGIEWQLPDLGEVQQKLTHELSWRDNNYHLQKNASHRDFPVRIFQASSHWELNHEDVLGQTQLSLEATYNPGSQVLSSSPSSYRALGGEDAQYWITQLNLNRSIRLGAAGSLHVRSEYQWTDDKLIGSDQSYVTGFSKVRGYDESLVNADKTLFFSTEWRYPVQRVVDQQWLQPLLFVDYAAFSDNGQSDGSDIASVGAGVRWKWANRMQGRADFGVPLRELATSRTAPMLQFSISSTW